MTKAVGAACRGRGHRIAGTPCQDAVSAIATSRLCCVALADGAGSRPHSHHGARLAVEATTRYVQKNLDPLLALADEHPGRVAELVLAAVLAAHRRFVQRKSYSIVDLACTLMFAGIKQGQLLAGHLGDGVIGLHDSSTRVLSAPYHGEYINTTFFVSDERAIQRFRIYRQSVVTKTGVLLMSDGTAESLYDRATGTLAPAADKIMGWAERLRSRELGQILETNLEQVFAQKTQDDCSLALLVSS